jgi:DNA-binding response OmpR family regulator
MEKAKILLLEDDPQLHEIVKEHLEDCNYAVFGAYNASDAAESLLKIYDAAVGGK